MKRLWMVGIAVLALVIAACGGSDGGDEAAATDQDAATTDGDSTDGDSTDADESGTATDGDSGDDGSEGDGDSGDDGSEGDDDRSDDDSGGGNTDIPRSGLAAAIFTLITEDSDFDSDEFTEEQAACVANGTVDEVGEDRLNDYGINEDTVGDVALDDIDFEEQDADALARVFVECADMLAVFQEGLGSPGAEEEQCIADAIGEDELVEFLSLGFQGRENEATNVLFGAAAGCIDFGSDDQGGNDTPIPSGGLDDIILDAMIDELSLTEAQISCVRAEVAGGRSLQNPADTVAILSSCGIEA